MEYMAKTDRQTDAPIAKDFKTRHWKSAIFDDDSTNSKGNWEKLCIIPVGWKVYQIDEICPTTGKPHKQIHVDCTRQQRLSALQNYVRATKWFPVMNMKGSAQNHIQNSIDYCQGLSKKEKGSIEGTAVVKDGPAYLAISDILMSLAREYVSVRLPTDEEHERMYFANTEEGRKYKFDIGYNNTWECLSAKLVEKDLIWVNRLTIPAVKPAWNTWGHIFINKVQSEKIK